MEEFNEEGRIPEKNSIKWSTIAYILAVCAAAICHCYKSWEKKPENKKAESTIVAPPVSLQQDQEQSAIEKWQELYMTPPAVSSSDEENK